MRDPEVTLELAREHGLTDNEYEKLLKILGRVPRAELRGCSDTHAAGMGALGAGAAGRSG